MPRKRIYILSILLSLTLSVFSQGYVQVTKNHEEYIMQQFTTMETGAGALTPRFYYNALHKQYQRTANVENKQLFRLHMKARVADEKVYADSIDSVTMRRAKVEALNVLDRQPLTDTAWPVEKSKIEGKLSISKVTSTISCPMVEHQKTIVSGRISTTVYRQPSRSHENPIKIPVRRNESTLPSTKTL